MSDQKKEDVTPSNNDHLVNVDFEDFHINVLPKRLSEGNEIIALDDVAARGGFGIRHTESKKIFTYLPKGNEIQIIEGEAGIQNADCIIELDQLSWSGLASDMETAPGLIYSGRTNAYHGNILHFMDWEPGLRAMYHGRPIFKAEEVQLKQTNGEPLDTSRRFSATELSQTPETLSHFLSEAGYLHIKQLFSKESVQQMFDAAQSARDEAVEGDQKSWWGKNKNGETVLCRVTNAGKQSAFHQLFNNPQLDAVAALAEQPLKPRGSASSPDGVTVLWKNPSVTEGLSDLPWHRDCGMGGHAHMCPILIGTVYLTAGTRDSGELRVIPGSHKGSFHFMDANDPKSPDGIGVETEAGDVTFHYSDLAHASMDPKSNSGPFRISALIAFVPPEMKGTHRGERHYNDALLGNEDGQVEHLRDKVKKEQLKQ